MRIEYKAEVSWMLCWISREMLIVPNSLSQKVVSDGPVAFKLFAFFSSTFVTNTKTSFLNLIRPNAD